MARKQRIIYFITQHGQKVHAASKMNGRSFCGLHTEFHAVIKWSKDRATFTGPSCRVC